MDIIIIQNIIRTIVAALAERSSNIYHHRKTITKPRLKRKVSMKAILEPSK
jgi:hypothetical protein